MFAGQRFTICKLPVISPLPSVSLRIQNVPAMPSLMPALRPAAGTLGNPVNLIVNMYLLKLTGDQLLHYDVSFERVRPVRGRAAAGGADINADMWAFLVCNSLQEQPGI